jgi:phage regulator Rha-like protein
MNEIIPSEQISRRIYLIRNHKVILDFDLAELYGVETKALKQAVRRNIERFPGDFMFVLSNQEVKDLRSQIVTSSWGGSRYSPMAFTEQGVAMLSSVLKSKRAIEVNIAVIRAFVKMQQILSSHEELKKKLGEMEAKYDENFQLVFEAIRQLLAEDESPTRRIGF